MKKIRIGCGSGGCTYERIEPAIELLEKGNLDYLVFECLAERTIANAQREKMGDSSKGYNPMLEERMRKLLPLAVKNKVKIISNMGGANTPAAVEKIYTIAKELSLKGLKIAMIEGDDLLHRIKDYFPLELCERKVTLESLGNSIVAANAYLGGDQIKEALDNGADIVITGRVADPSLFVGPLKHEFAIENTNSSLLGQSILLGHLMECAGQLTGGYYADPGYKDVPDLYRLGFPIAEINEEGELFFTKVDGSGGMVTESICKEQLLYEIGDPSCYITPDGIVDFSQVRFSQEGKDKVSACGAVAPIIPDTCKVNIAYQDGFIGEAEISYGGSNAINRAKLAAEIVQKRLEYTNVHVEELRFDYIGYNSLFKESISSMLTPDVSHEIRFRMAARAKTHEDAIKAIREVECLYINGPAGGGGITSKVYSVLCVENIIIPASDISTKVTLLEV